MRIVAILAAYNEERFIGGCLEHLSSQGVEAYLLDNCSTDRTVEIAEQYLGNGLIDIETFPRPEGMHRWQAILQRKEELAESLEADWFMHADPDEIRLAPQPDQTLAEAFAEVDARGYNAVNFIEFTFIPTKESPEHNHPDFLKTMRWYYPFMKRFPYQIKGWKWQPQRVDLVNSGGHFVRFPDQKVYPESFRMRHYQFLSLSQARIKYENKKKRASEAERRQVGWRVQMVEERMTLPSQDEFNVYNFDGVLDLSNPRTRHVIEDWAPPQEEKIQPRNTPRSPNPHSSAPPAALDMIGKGSEDGQKRLPVVIGGCYGSGGSLVRQLLNAHSRIHCGTEVRFFRDFYDDYVDDPISHERFVTTARRMLPDPLPFRVLGRAFVALHEHAAKRAGKPRWADIDPDNVVYLKEWESLLGDNWSFVHIVRNPLDTLASIKEYTYPHLVPAQLSERIELYKRYTQAGLNFAELHPDRYYRVVYEQLVEQPQAVTSDLMNWLGERFEPAQLNLDISHFENRTESPEDQAIKAGQTESVGSWKKLLMPSEVERISQECDALWHRLSARSSAKSNSPGKEQKDLLTRLGFRRRG